MPRNSFVKFKYAHENFQTASVVTNGIAILPIKTNCLLNPIGLLSMNSASTFAPLTGLNPTGLPTWSNFYQKYYVYKTKVTLTLQNNGPAAITMFSTEDPFFNNPVLPELGASAPTDVDIRELPATKMKMLSAYGGPNDCKSISRIFKTKNLAGNTNVKDVNWWGNVNPVLSNPGFFLGLFGWWQTGVYDTANATFATQYTVRITYYTKLFERILLTNAQ